MRKKHLLALISLLLVVCLLLTGCGRLTRTLRNTLRRAVRKVTGEILTPATKAPVPYELEPAVPLNPDSYADDVWRDDEDDEDDEDWDDDDYPEDFLDEYTFNFGGYVLTIHVDVFDYIDEDTNAWYASEMASDMGWDPYASRTDGSKTVSLTAKQPAYFSDGIYHITYDSGSKKNNYLGGYLTGEKRIFSVGIPYDGHDYCYRMNDSEHYWPIEMIVCFAYAMENMSGDEDPFADVFGDNNGDHVIP